MSHFYTDPKNAGLVDDMYYRFFEEGLHSFADRCNWKEVEEPIPSIFRRCGTVDQVYEGKTQL